jgi:hypothetical protein
MSLRPGRPGGSRALGGAARGLARATWAERGALAAAPFLARGAVGAPASAATLLRAVAVVHAALARPIERVPGLAPLAPVVRGALGALLEDLARVAPAALPSSRPAIEAALELADRALVDEHAAPASLVGVA